MAWLAVPLQVTPRKVSLLTRTMAPTDDTPRLFTIPQELQDIIFDLAYPRDYAMFRTPKLWLQEQKQSKRHNASYLVVPFPSVVKVDSFLVTKRFLVAAAKAWIKNQTKLQNRRHTTEDALGCYPVDGIYHAFIIELRCTSWNSAVLQ